MPSVPITSASTTTTLVAGVPGLIYRVMNYQLTEGTAFGTAQWFSDLAPLSGNMVLDKGTPLYAQDMKLFDTEIGGTLKLVTAGGTVTGHMYYEALGSPQLNANGTQATNIQGTLDFSLTADSMLLVVGL